MWSYSIGFCLLLIQTAALPSPTPQPSTSDAMNFLWFFLGTGLGIGIGILLSIAFRKSRNKVEEQQRSSSILNIPQRNIEEQKERKAKQYVQRCPVCSSTYTDATLTYCVSDGASLVRVNDESPTYDPNATELYPERGRRDLPPTQPYRPK